MKKQSSRRWTFFAVLFLFAATAQSQTLKDFFSNEGTNALYLGIDFTKNKVIDDANANTTDIRDRQYNAINDLVVAEQKRNGPPSPFHRGNAFDLRWVFHRTNNMDHDLGLVNERNVKSNADEIKSTNTSDFHRLKEEDIAKLVKEYNFKDKKGLGILLVSEAMSKSQKAIAIWVTFVDMNTKKVLLTDRVEGKVGMGFGFANYWATGVRNILEQVEKKEYKDWKGKAGA